MNDNDEEPLSEHDASRYRAMAGRASFLATDRTDLMYSTKEICRGMAEPTEGDWKKLKRLGRYLLGSGRLTTHDAWQRDEESVTSFSDSDWAECKVTAESTSGGVMMVGTLISAWPARRRRKVSTEVKETA